MQFRFLNSSFVLVPALAVATVTLAGCGGSGHSNSGPAAPVGSTLRSFQAGDGWTYVVSGWEYRTGSANIYVTSGSYTRAVQQDGSTGDMSFTHALNVKWNDNSSTTENWLEDFVQSADRQVSRRGDTLDNTIFGTAGNFEVADQVTPAIGTDLKGNPIVVGIAAYQSQPELPGTWSLSTGLSSDDSYEIAVGNGSSGATITTTNHEHFGVTVIGQETVTVPAGTFVCWKTNMVTGYQTQGRTINATAWWAPQLGSFVKMDTTETVSTGQQQLHYVLQSTTVAH